MLIVSPLIFVVVVILLSTQIALELRRQKVSRDNGRVYRNHAERYTGIVGEMVRGGKDIKLLKHPGIDELHTSLREANICNETAKSRSAAPGTRNHGKYSFQRW